MPELHALSSSQAILLSNWKQELRDELDEIISYWINYTQDGAGGFYGSVSSANEPDINAPRGIVLYSRILWTFSAAAVNASGNGCMAIADKAFHYIVNHFTDKEHGGVFWSVDSNGAMLDSKKQIYGIAFCIYGLAEYYKLTNNEHALELAIEFFHYIETRSFDKINKGYLEALTRDGSPIADQRLSEKDSNEKKSMNTHLHIVEAYANLYQVWPDPELQLKITGLLDVFEHHIINKDRTHLDLFFTEWWDNRSATQSFGHDIEAAWLLEECAIISKSNTHIDLYKRIAIDLSKGAATAQDEDGGLWYEFDPASVQWIYEKHWWPQAEAMVGFFNCFQLSGEQDWLDRAYAVWQFIQKYLKDQERGEWFWGVDAHYLPMKKEKAGFWKCPYHNGRACMEMIRRIESVER